MNNQEIKHNPLFTVGFTLLFGLLSCWGILHHEIWFDEGHCLLLARDSDSFSELVNNIRQEGHPLIWFSLLWIITRFSEEVVYMQLLHILISTFNVYLLLRYSPFSKIKKVLFSFSYFFFYEYNIISRNYALCLLGITLFCILCSREHRNYFWMAIMLALIANCHFLGLLLSLIMAGLSLLLLVKDERQQSKFSVGATAALILLSGYLVCWYFVQTPENSLFYELPRSEFFSVKRWSAFTTSLKALYPIPVFWGEKIWNTSLLTAYKPLGFLLSMILPLLLLQAFKTRPLSLLIIFAALLLYSSFFLSGIMHNYTTRHWGFIFLAFYVALWLEKIPEQQAYQKRMPGFLQRTGDGKGVYKFLIYSVLLAQVLAGGLLYVSDLFRNFSNARPMVDFMQKQGLTRHTVMVCPYTEGANFSAYLKKEVYYPEYPGFGSFARWSGIHTLKVNKLELMQDIQRFHTPHDSLVLIIDEKLDLNNDTLQAYQDDFEMQFLKGYEESMKQNEHFYLYLIRFLPKDSSYQQP